MSYAQRNGIHENFFEAIGSIYGREPKKTMIYAIDRETPEKNLEKISQEELEKIAERLRKSGFVVECFGK